MLCPDADAARSRGQDEAGSWTWVAIIGRARTASRTLHKRLPLGRCISDVLLLSRVSRAGAKISGCVSEVKCRGQCGGLSYHSKVVEVVCLDGVRH